MHTLDNSFLRKFFYGVVLFVVVLFLTIGMDSLPAVTAEEATTGTPKPFTEINKLPTPTPTQVTQGGDNFTTYEIAPSNNNVNSNLETFTLASTPPRFLTLPFKSDSGVYLQGGWWYTASHASMPDYPTSADHQGIDYLRSDYASFAVLSAYEGYAKWRWSETYGNVIEIKHTINQEIWFTIYAHLQDILIPMDNQTHFVARGTHIGNAGKTGVWPAGSVNAGKQYTTIHLHFELVKNAPPKVTGYERVDPYGVYGGANYYPGNSTAFTTNPPSYATTIVPSICSAPSNGIPRDTPVLNNSQVTFTWSPPACNGLDYYTFRVSNHADIDNPPWIIDHGVSSNSSSQTENIPTQYNGQTLYWAIWPHNGNGYGTRGGPWTFKIDTSAPPTPNPIPTVDWAVQYFRNKELSDQCNSETFTHAFIFKDWGDGIPVSSCNSDNWSARFSKRISFQGGNYDFWLEADDWGRIYVDNVLFLDKWNGASQHHEGHFVSAGDHDVRIEFADTMGSAKISAWWWGPGFNIPQDTQDPYQWFANYWINPTQWWDSYAKVNEGSGSLSHEWSSGSPGWDIPPDNFSASYQRTAYFNCGQYQFTIDHDDGAKVFIDNNLVVDRWSGSIGSYSFYQNMTQGDHALKVDYYENGGSAHIFFNWVQTSTCVPPTPVLVSPENGNTYEWNTDFTLDWNPSTNATQYFATLRGGPGVDISSGWVTDTQWYIGGLWPGTYTWSVTSRNNYGSSLPSGTRTFIVQDSPPVPSANFDSWPQSGDAPLTVSMHIVSMSNITSCSWNYGDGTTSTTCTAYHDHIYNNPGSYTVTLTVTGPGGSDSMTRQDYIVVDQQIPSVPTGVSASDGTYTDKVRVSWTGSSSATYYRVYRNTSNSTIGVTILDSPNSSPYDDTTAIAGTTYWYFVKACNDQGYSGFSAGNLGYRAVSVPGAPTGVAASDGTFTDKVRISWVPVIDATYYEVYRNTSNSSIGVTILNSPTTTPYDDTGATPGTTYYYFVKACNSAGCSGYSTGDSGYLAAIDTEPPVVNWIAPVGNEQIFDVTNQLVTLEVTATDNVGVSYVHFRRWDYINLEFIDIGDDYSSPYSIVLDSNGLRPNQNEIQALAFDDAGNSDNQFIWLNNIGLIAPTRIKASDGTYTDKVRVSWSSSSGATYYDLYKNTSNTSIGASWLWSLHELLYDDTSATAGKKYYYFVRACNYDSCSAFSASDSGYRASSTLVPIPKTPYGTIYDRTPTYKWTKVTNATKYQYQLWQGTTLIYTKYPASSVCGTTYCTHTPTTFLGYKAHKWRVRAYVGGVWKPWSAYKYFTVAKAATSD